MKILQIINSLATGGAEKLLLETIPIYREKGIAMDLLVLNDSNAPFLAELQKLQCCTIHSLGKQSVYSPIHVFKLMRYLKNYDIVHVHLFPAQYWVVLAKIMSFSKIKLFFTEHNTSNRRLANTLFRIIDRRIYQFYTVIVCITEAIKEILSEHTALPTAKFHVIENGVNLSTINKALAIEKKQIDTSLRSDDPLLIQVAGFREQKDQITLIHAMVLLPPTVKLVLVGDGLLKKECQELVESLKLKERVLFLGLRMDVPQLLKTADIVVLSSKYEGLSLSSIEGMASGKPFVAADVPGLSDIVQGAGILFPVGNSEQLAVEITKLLADQDHYQSVAVACQQRAANYDIHKMVDQHIKLYQSVLET